MMRAVIVGRGILGLSIAEFMSRSGKFKVDVISSVAHPSASSAAAANLSTKAQVFARDPHFDLKIRGKSIYSDWLIQMRRELGEPNADDLSEIFSLGMGRDVFTDDSACNAQWRRVVQPAEEIRTRGLAPQKVNRPNPFWVEYADEGWVDAEAMLQLLERICRKRGVGFLEANVMQVDAFPHEVQQPDHLILAAGSHTPQILSAWGVELTHPVFQKSRRWSFGGTLELKIHQDVMPSGVTLLEIVPAQGPLSKLTFSGRRGRIFCSSISVKCADRGFSEPPVSVDLATVEEQKKFMLEMVESTFGLSPASFTSQFRWGMRLGFGHSELVAEQLAVPKNLENRLGKSLFVAAGAHKSGFLFAPCMGQLVLQKMQA